MCICWSNTEGWTNNGSGGGHAELRDEKSNDDDAGWDIKGLTQIRDIRLNTTEESWPWI